MKAWCALLLAAFAAIPAKAQSVVQADQFANRSTIRISEKLPYQQVILPIAVYQGLLSADLGDLRVFNGLGEAVPYAIVRREAASASRRTEQQVPFFPLRTPAGTGGDALDVAVTVRQGSDGTLVSVRQSATPTSSAEVVRGVVVDASQIRGSIRSLRLLGGASAMPFHAYSIESSQDLQHWRMLKRDAQLVRLAHEGHRVERDGAEWDSPADRYLRLLWADPQRAPAIASVLLAGVETSHEDPPRIWSGEVAPSVVQPGIYEYDLPGQLPLERLRINLPQINSLAPFTIQQPVIRHGWHRHRHEQDWETLVQGVAYRLDTPQGEIRSPDFVLHGEAVNRLRLSLDQRAGSLGGTKPTLQVGFVPLAVVFLARGEEPFTLAWGANNLRRGDLPLATLVPGQGGSVPLQVAVASLDMPKSQQGTPETLGAKIERPAGATSGKWVLWLVLLGGLLLLGGMAAALSRQLRQGAKRNS